MAKLVSTSGVTSFTTTKKIKQPLDQCLEVMISNGISVDNNICFLHKSNGLWRLNCEGKDYGYLSNDDKDICFKQLVTEIKKVLGTDVLGIVFPSKSKVYYEGKFSVITDQSSLNAVYDLVCLTDETLNGRLVWFLPFLVTGTRRYASFNYFAYDKVSHKVLSMFPGLLGITEEEKNLVNGLEIERLDRVVDRKFRSKGLRLPAFFNYGVDVIQYSDMLNKRGYFIKKALKSININTNPLTIEYGQDNSFRIMFRYFSKEGQLYFKVRVNDNNSISYSEGYRECRHSSTGVTVPKDFFTYPHRIVVSAFVGGNDAVINNEIFAGTGDLKDVMYVDYEKGRLTKVRPTFGEVLGVFWFEDLKNLSIKYIVIYNYGDNVTARMYSIDLKTELVKLLFDKSIPIGSIKEGTLTSWNPNKGVLSYLGSEDGVYRIHNFNVDKTRTVYCYYSNKSNELYLSKDFIRFKDGYPECIIRFKNGSPECISYKA